MSTNTNRILQAIARCDQEIAEMENQNPVQPAYLTTLGIEDWRAERRFLERELLATVTESDESYEAAAAVFRMRAAAQETK